MFVDVLSQFQRFVCSDREERVRKCRENFKSYSSEYPKEQYIYVGIGRSPVAIMAYLQSEEGTVVCNLPFTNFRYGFDQYLQLNSTEENKLFQHFDDYLPLEFEKGERKKFLLVDFGHTGRTIASSYLYFSRYIEHHRPSLTGFDGVIICTEAGSQEIKSLCPFLNVFPLVGIRETETSPDQFDHLLIMIASRLYLVKAEYTIFDIKNPTVPNKRGEYYEYVNEMREPKRKSKLGTLDDIWINTLFEIGADQKKEEEIMAIVKERIKLRESLIGNVSSEEETMVTKEVISELVASKWGESVSSHSTGWKDIFRYIFKYF